MEPVITSALGKAISTVVVKSLKEMSSNLFNKDLENILINKTDFDFIIDQKILLEEFPEIEVKPLAQFLKSEYVELIVQQIYNPDLTRNSIEEIRNEFCLSFSSYFEVEISLCNSFASTLFEILIEGCKITLNKAISQGLISALDAKTQFRLNLIEDKLDKINKNIKDSQIAIENDIAQMVNIIKSSGLIDFPKDQNITFPNSDTILNEIGDWIETAKHSWDVNNDFNEALRIYGIAENKLKTHPNNELLLKVLVGKSVCFHYKGNTGMANKLLQQAKEIDEKHPIVLANISSILRTSGNIDEAEIYANKALEYDNHCILAKTVLALIEYKKGNLSEALRMLKEAININQNDAYPVYSMSYIYSKENQFEEAIDYGKKAVNMEKTTPSYYQHLGNIYLEASSPKNEIFIKDEFYKKINKDFILKSIQCFEKAIELNISQNNEHLNSSIYPNLASALLVNDHFEASIEFNEKAIECGIEFDEIYMNLGMAHISLGNFKKCIEYYEPLVAKGIDSFVVRANLSLAYLIDNRLDDAELLLETLISKSPEHLYLHIHLAQVKDKKREFQQGIEVLNRASKSIPLNWHANYLLGRLHYKNEVYDLAARYFKQAIKQNNEAIIPIRDLIDLYLECQMPEYALKYAEDLVDLNPENKSIHYFNIAVIHHDMEDYLSSIEYAKKALELGYEDVKVYRLICTSLLIECLIEEARNYFDAGLKDYPEDLDLRHNYAILLSQTGDTEEAIDILNNLIESDNESVAAHITLSNIYYSLGNDEMAIEYATKATTIKPEDEYAHFILGNILSKVGRIDEAVDQFNIMRNINPKSKLVIYAPIEHILSIFDNQFDELKDAIDEYENGYITLSRASEIAHVSISNILNHSNNEKIAKSLNLSDDQLKSIEDITIKKKSVVVDIAILEILSQVGELQLLHLCFDNVYVTKEFENDIFKRLYRAEEPYREIRTKLSISKNGWIKGLVPNKESSSFLSKILPISMFSRKEIEFISLAIDNGAIYLTEDLLARYKMRDLNIPAFGLYGFLNSAIENKLIIKEAAVVLYEKLSEKKYISHFYDLK